MFQYQKRKVAYCGLAATFLTAITCSTALAETIVVLPGNNSTSFNGRAPQGSRLFIRTAYYITPGEMAASAFGTNTVSGVGWRWNAPSPPAATGPIAQNAPTTGSILIYLQNSTDLGYAKGNSFSAAIEGMTLVANGTIGIQAGPDEFTINVPVGGAGTSPFSTIAGLGVYVVFDYQTTSALALPFPSPNVLCTNVLTNGVNGCATYQSQTTIGNIMTSSAFRPETRFVKVVNIDIDDDGDVDGDDLFVFVQVLLGLDSTVIHVIRSDVNSDGQVNGRDIQPFTSLFLTP